MKMSDIGALLALLVILCVIYVLFVTVGQVR
jgi:hypothetical protein